MRLKAIPSEIGHYATAHPVIVIGGVALLAVGGYYYWQNRTLSDAYNADPSASTSAQFTYGMPQYPGTPIPSGAGGTTGIVDSVSGAGAGVTSAADQSLIDLQYAALGLETTKANNEYDIAKRTLTAQLGIARNNADVAMAGIQSSNYMTSAMLAQTFINSGQLFSAGNIGGTTFAFLGTGNAPSDERKFDTENFSRFQQILGSTGIQGLFGNGTQSGTGTSGTSTPSYAQRAASVQSIGSAGVTPSLARPSTSSSGGTTGYASTAGGLTRSYFLDSSRN